jgi:acyl dehydratase
MTLTLDGIDGVRAATGTDLDPGPWFEIDQARITSFADVTEDWQWIHVDTERAAGSDLGGTIAHGYLTLSLVPRLSNDVFTFANIGRALNYGLDKVRFLSPVRPGDRVRARATIASADDSGPGVLARVRYTIEIEDQERPACVVEALMLVLPAAD